MSITQAQRETYYSRVMDGTTRKQKDRVMRFMLQIHHPVTRHQLAHVFKADIGGKAFDGGPPIPLQSICSAIYSLMGGKKRKSKNGDFVRVSHKGTDPITGADNVDFLVPIGDKWAQRRVFDDFG